MFTPHSICAAVNMSKIQQRGSVTTTISHAETIFLTSVKPDPITVFQEETIQRQFRWTILKDWERQYSALVVMHFYLQLLVSGIMHLAKYTSSQTIQIEINCIVVQCVHIYGLKIYINIYKIYKKRHYFKKQNITPKTGSERYLLYKVHCHHGYSEAKARSLSGSFRVSSPCIHGCRRKRADKQDKDVGAFNGPPVPVQICSTEPYCT